MIRVTALTSGRDDPSSRFRIRQYIEPLSRLGIRVSEFYPPLSKYRLEPVKAAAWLARAPGVVASRFSDITWLGRELISGGSTLERWTGKRRLFDVDDAIWLAFPTPFSEKIAQQCYGVIAGNPFLAEHYRPHCPQVWVVPTAIDTDVWAPSPRTRRSTWVIGWSGSFSNLRYLMMIEKALAGFLASHSGSRLLVVCDRKPEFSHIPPPRWTYEPWSATNEVKLLNQMDVGLMPLPDSEWARGKCAFKMISYMAVGLPVVVSPVGANRDVLEKGPVGIAAESDDDWHSALAALFEDPEKARLMGMAGRGVVIKHYSVMANVKQLAQIFNEAVGGDT